MANLTRSELERKSKDDLESIAKAMGGKPASRARKAEIINLIVNLAGIELTEDSSSNHNKEDTSHSSASQSASQSAFQNSVSENSATRNTATATATTATATTGTTTGRTTRVFHFDDGSETISQNGSVYESELSEEDAAFDAVNGDTGGTNGDTASGQAQGQEHKTTKAETAAGKTSENNRPDGSTRNNDARNNDSFADQDAERRRRRRNRNRNDDQPVQVVDIEGYLDLRQDGFGFLRVKAHKHSKEDVYVSVKQIKQFGLRKGDHVKGASRQSAPSEKNPALLRIDEINGKDPQIAKHRPDFESLTPLFPDERLRLEREGDSLNMTTRIIDLLSPIGKGQRGLIVSPPKAGKTTIMKEIARSIEVNNPEVYLLVLLVDERPEEVTDMRRWLKRPTSEVVASTFDRPADEHTYISEMVIERAKRMVEEGKDVVIILDGITRLARAYNQNPQPNSSIMSGGVYFGSLYPPKKFFGAARNLEEGGSLTIVATALVETGSRMDEVIFEEFKGTGNMELRLDRRSAERRIYPAIDVDSSSTRHEELLMEREQLQQVWKLRRVLSGLVSENDGNGAAGLELLIDRLKQFPSNDAFLDEVAQGQMRT